MSELPEEVKPDDGSDIVMQDLAFRSSIDAAKLRIRVNEAARQELANEAFEIASNKLEPEALEDILIAPDEDYFLIDRLIPADASSLVYAEGKAGKSVWIFNMIHSLITGEDFLGEFPVRRLTGNVGYVNFEISKSLIKKWSRARGLDGPEFRGRIKFYNAMGKTNPFASEAGRIRLKEQMEADNIEFIVVDTFGAAIGENGENSDKTRPWLEENLTWLRVNVSTCKELLLTAHAGKDISKGIRGHTALRDWPASIITLIWNKSTNVRSMKALGREVDEEERNMVFDKPTHTYTMGGLTAKSSAAEGLDVLVKKVVGVLESIGSEVNSGQLVQNCRDAGVSFPNEKKNDILNYIISNNLAIVRGTRPILIRPLGTEEGVSGKFDMGT